MIALKHGRTEQVLFRLANLTTFGLYTHREKSTPEFRITIDAKQDEAERLSFRYLPITNLREDENGALRFERVEWRDGLPLKIWEDAHLKVPPGERATWLNEWHTDLEWLRALHKTEYSNGLIGLHEELARHSSEALATDAPELTPDECWRRRFRSRAWCPAVPLPHRRRQARWRA